MGFDVSPYRLESLQTSVLLLALRSGGMVNCNIDLAQSAGGNTLQQCPFSASQLVLPSCKALLCARSRLKRFP